MKHILILLIFLSASTLGLSQAITGGGGICHVDADPNTVTTINAAQSVEYDCHISWRSDNNTIYYYDGSLAAGSRWVLIPLNSGAITAVSYAAATGIVTITEDGANWTFTVPAMVGATAIADGEQGLVPKPLTGEDDEFLTGAGTFEPVLQEATTVTDAANGLDIVETGNDITISYDWSEHATDNIPVNASDLLMFSNAAGTTFATSTISNLSAYSNVTTLTTAAPTLDETHNVILASGASNAVAIALPDATTVTGREYRIKAIDLTNAVSIDPSGAQTIDGSATYSFSTVNDEITVVSDGTNWRIIESNLASAGEATTVTDAVNGLDIVLTGADITVDLDINELTTETVVDKTLDFVAYYDASATDERKMTVGNLLSQISISLAADAGVAEVVSDTETMTIAGGLGLASVVAATNTVTLNMDINSEVTEVVALTDELVFSDIGDNGIHKTTVNDLLNLHSITIAGDTGSETVVNTNTITFGAAVGFTMDVTATDNVTLNYSFSPYDDDAAAAAGGILINELYIASTTNTMGLSPGVLKVRLF